MMLIMTKFYTGKGDKGESNLGGEKVSKSSKYAEAIGALDEINTWLGLSRVEIKNSFVAETLRKIQETLFIAQSEVGALGAGHKPQKSVSEIEVKILEDAISKVDKEIPELTHFIIPGGSRESALLDVARTLARRAERRIVAFYKDEPRVSDELLQFINRLSSTLFALARYMNYIKGVNEDHPQYN